MGGGDVEEEPAVKAFVAEEDISEKGKSSGGRRAADGDAPTGGGVLGLEDIGNVVGWCGR